MDFSGGVDSHRVPLIASPANPNGLKPNQLAWLINGSVRNGGITQRTGWTRLFAFPHTAAFQEAKMYSPDSGFPYIIAQIGGRTFLGRVDTDNSVQEVTIAGDANPATLPQNWMCQAELFMIIQDGVSTPLVWDGSVLRRIGAVPGVTSPLPTAESMDYYMGRVWLALGREYVAGNIIAPNLSAAPYRGRETVLNFNENTYLNGGGAFIVPDNAGNVRALAHAASLDTQLGQGLLFVFTRSSIFSVNVPVERADWAALEEPAQRVANINFGTTSDRSIVKLNGDLFFQYTGGVSTLAMAIRYFQQWSNTPISSEMHRATELNDRELLRYGSGIEFDNRVLQTVLPEETPVGVAHAAIMSLDLELLNSLSERLPPAWEGVQQGVKILRLLEGDFGGRQRAFAIVYSELNEQIECWELTNSERFDVNVVTADNDNGEVRVEWTIETPSYTWDQPFMLKELESMELWVDKLFGEVEFTVYFRPDQHPCWLFWHQWKECAARNECDLTTAEVPCTYPQQTYREQYRSMMVLPKPVAGCNNTNSRPFKYGYSFQLKIVIKGWCRVRGLLVHALPRERQSFDGMRC